MKPPTPPPLTEAAPQVAAPTVDTLLDESLHETFPASDPISPSAADLDEAAEHDGPRGAKPVVVDASPPAPPADKPLFPTADNPERER